MCLALGDRKLVAAFVLRVACVAFDPDVGELVAGFRAGEPSDFFQPRRFQPLAQPFSSPLMTYWLSEHSRTSQGSLSWRSASMKAVSSIRLLVVEASPPLSSFS